MEVAVADRGRANSRRLRFCLCRTVFVPWSAWDAADHNADGKLTREEMERFGKQMSHRNVEQLLRNFDAADTNHDGIVTQQEIDAYGTDIGSREPQNRRQ